MAAAKKEDKDKEKEEDKMKTEDKMEVEIKKEGEDKKEAEAKKEAEVKKEVEVKSKPDEKSDEELVLTNTGLTTGFHFWEIIASISCKNIKVGVYNPITKTELVTNFNTITQRVITLGLDLNEGSLKFWLNGRRQSNKTLKVLPVSGPWVPCVKISQERNSVSLNPFAREPASFSELHFVDRT